MKQHLFPEDWGPFERANPEAAKKLHDYYAEWQKNYLAEKYPYSFVTMQWDPIFVWFTIGRMMEFLLDMKRDKRYKKSQPIEFFQKQYYMSDYDDAWWKLVPEQLCDDLWEEVKKVVTKLDK